MRAKVLFKCVTIECSLNGKSQDFSGRPLFFDPMKCGSCHEFGTLEITAGDRTFKSSSAYMEYIKGLNKELRLLVRLEKAGVVEEIDIARKKEIYDIVDEAVCPCCLGKFPNE